MRRGIYQRLQLTSRPCLTPPIYGWRNAYRGPCRIAPKPTAVAFHQRASSLPPTFLRWTTHDDFYTPNLHIEPRSQTKAPNMPSPIINATIQSTALAGVSNVLAQMLDAWNKQVVAASRRCNRFPRLTEYSRSRLSSHTYNFSASW